MKPILFSTAMVQAILAGRKTQTRRVVKTRSWICDVEDNIPYEMTEDDTQPIKCPYGKVGDVLWVRETHWAYGHWVKNGTTSSGKQKWKFVRHLDADVLFEKPSTVVRAKDRTIGWHKRSSLFMPLEYCRLFLRIKSFRVELLQDITEQDAIAEGVEAFEGNSNFKNYMNGDSLNYFYVKSAKLSFRSLWQSINGEQSWNDNPFVWVIEFNRIEKPTNL